MRVICPEHQGIIYVPGDFSIGNIKNMVVECPVCNEQVLIDESCVSEEMQPHDNNK